jgi:hypothetical protein
MMPSYQCLPPDSSIALMRKILTKVHFKSLWNRSPMRLALLLGLPFFWSFPDQGTLPTGYGSADEKIASMLHTVSRNSEDMVSRAYQATDRNITNPERGFYYTANCEGAVDPEKLLAWRREQGVTLAVCSVDLQAFVERRIDEDALDLFDKNMLAFRTAGLKAILRFSYSADIAGRDASREQISEHLDQLKPYLEKNKDVIAVVHAGFIGGWGEWAYSQHFGNLGQLSESNWADRRAVVEKLLGTVPRERMVQLRTPEFKRRFTGGKPLQQAEAFSGSDRARLAHHNDCFLASANDWGTYTRLSVEYPYLQADTTFLPMGGETCNYEPKRSNCENALRELSRFHYSYLNASYHPDVLRTFRQQGCYGDIQRKLGYRIVLRQGEFSREAHPGGAMSLRLTVQNEGWAAPYNQRRAELVLRNVISRAKFRFVLDTDPRLWLPSQQITVQQTIELPRDLPTGSYELLLHLPDAAPSLHDRPEYSIRMAVAEGWESETGFNQLGHVIT